ncbi:MAG: DUF4390 domain-containing protein [Mariprofundaceae bacterium]|nr:DUF4390 domain-containing protein [Mariprofundaceae bacterium]
MHIFYRYITHLFLMFFMGIVALGSAIASSKSLPSDVMLSKSDAIYCDAYSMLPLEKVKTLLADGAIVSASWQFKTTRERKYWLDQTVANMEIIHQVTPDLIAGRWMLLNVSTGQVKTTRFLQHALRFLLEVHAVSLASKNDIKQWALTEEAETLYHVHVRLHISDGLVAPTGWRAWLRLGKTVAVRSFSLP